jgi:rsbT antagonist protein RsbS
MAEQTLSIVKVYDVLIATMPSDPDDATVTELQEQILQRMDATKAKGLVLDVSSVETLDSFFARTTLETARMIHLMGGRTVIVGMQPSVAITATQLGLAQKLKRVTSAVNVDSAMDILSRRPPGTGQ